MTMIRGKVVGCMTTFPGRFDIIRQTVASIACQLDALLLYVNESTEGLPDLSDLRNVTIFDGQDHAGDLLANGKAYLLKFLQDCEVFTLDDDFIYPPDYVAKNLDILRKMGGRCLVTTHGSVVQEDCDWYYERHSVFISTSGVVGLQMCNLAGSGTACFDQRRMPVDADDLLEKVMVDLKLSLAARDAGLPLFVLPREEGWLTVIRKPGLREKYSGVEITHHTELARRERWDFATHARNARTALAAAGIGPAGIGLDPATAHCLDHGGLPPGWKHDLTSILTRDNYLSLLNRILDDETIA